MSELDKNLNLSFILESGPLQQIAFSLHQVILHFRDGVKIDIETSCEIKGPDRKEVWTWEPERVCDMRGFASLLDLEISSYKTLTAGVLAITFANNAELVLWDHEDGYESFLIYDKNGIPIVI